MDIDKLMSDILGGKLPNGAQLITAGSREELLAKLGEAMQEEVREQEHVSALTQMAVEMTPAKAVQLAAGALLGAAEEFQQGHTDHANIKVMAADVWDSIANTLLSIEDRQPPVDEKPQALLGLATTGQMLGELLVRFETVTPNQSAFHDIQTMLEQMDPETLNYQTALSSGSDE